MQSEPTYVGASYYLNNVSFKYQETDCASDFRPDLFSWSMALWLFCRLKIVILHQRSRPHLILRPTHPRAGTFAILTMWVLGMEMRIVLI